MTTIWPIIAAILTLLGASIAWGVFEGWRDARHIREQAEACRRLREPALHQAVANLKRLVEEAERQQQVSSFPDKGEGDPHAL